MTEVALDVEVNVYCECGEQLTVEGCSYNSITVESVCSVCKEQARLDGFEDGFAGRNAAGFLGLTPGSKAMGRLERFYDEKLDGHRPGWWGKV